MEKDTLRRHVYEEIHSQFETKLREAKRQKTQVEEELESLSEKWRSERRRLNGEIDRLEAALADAKDGRKRPGLKGGRATDSEDLLKAQQSGEEKFKKASESWNAERAGLQAEIKRLELGLAEVLERSSNPMRSAQAVRESLEARLEEALRARQRVEEEYSTAKAQWEREKTRFDTELVKLRRSMAKSRTSDEEEALQQKLRDALSATKASEQEVTELRQKYGQQVASLQKELQQARDLVGEVRIQAEKAQDECKLLRAANTEHEARFSSTLAQTRAEAASAQKRLADELARTKEQLESLQKMRSNETLALHTEAASAQKRLADELARTKEQLESLQKMRSDETLPREPQDRSAGPASAGLSDQLQEVMRHRNFLQQQLHQAEDTIRIVRAEQSEEFAQLTAQLQEARVEGARIRKSLERDLQKAREDAESTQTALSAQIDELRNASVRPGSGSGSTSQDKAELQELRRHNEELKQQLQDTKETLAKLQQEHSKLRELSGQLDTLRVKSDQAAAKYKEELRKATAELETLRQKQAPAAAGRQGSADSGRKDEGFAYQLREVMQQRNYLQQQVHQAEEAIRALRAEHAAEKQTLMAQLEETRGNSQRLETRLDAHAHAVNADAVEQVRRQYDERIQEIVQQKTQLSEQLHRANAMLEAERKRAAKLPSPSAPGSGGTAVAAAGVDQRRIQDEVRRVESVIHGITTLIDDPSVELSTVIRKNVERAEWDAYLKGMLFSLGKAAGK